MSLAPCAAAPSLPLHAMPPRITRNSDRPRASDRTMVDTQPPVSLAQLQHSMDGVATQKMKPERKGKPRAKHTPYSGLDLETKSSRPSGRGGSFFLTSLFIELIDPRLTFSTPGSFSNISVTSRSE